MRGHSLAIANHSTSHLAWQLTGWSPRQPSASTRRRKRRTIRICTSDMGRMMHHGFSLSL